MQHKSSVSDLRKKFESSESLPTTVDKKKHFEQLQQANKDISKKSASPAHKKAKAKKIFQKFDTDGSGDIDAKEFQVLAFELGLPLTDTEAQDYIKAIDTDGNGTIDFDEFYAWWSSEDHKADESSPERAKQLQVLKMKLRSKALLKNAAVLTNTLAKEAEKAKSLSDSSINSYDMEFFSGELKEIGSSIALTHVVSAEEAKKVRAVAKVDDQTVALVINVLTKDGVDPFELGEIGGSVKAILDMAKEELKYHSFTTGFTKDGNKNLFQLVFTFSEAETPELAAVNAIIEALKISRLSATYETSDRIGRENTGYPAANFKVKAEVDRNVLLELANGLGGEEKKGMVLLAGLRRLHFSLHFADLNTVFSPELFPELYTPGTPHSFQELRQFFVGPLADVLTNDELPSQFVELYEQALKLLSGLDSIKIAIGTNVFCLQLEGFPIFEGYLPTVSALKEIKAASTPPPGLENISFNVETDGGQVEGYDALWVTLESIDSFVYSTVNEKNVNLIFTPSAEDTEYFITNIFVRNPTSGFTSPVKNVLFWVLPSKPQFSDFDKYNDYTKEQFDDDSSATKPVAFVEVPRSGGVQVSLDKWAKGKYVFAKLLNAHGPDNIDVEFIGFAGFVSSAAPAEYKVINAAQTLHVSNIPGQDPSDLGINF